jgi:hypothetical protein
MEGNAIAFIGIELGFIVIGAGLGIGKLAASAAGDRASAERGGAITA